MMAYRFYNLASSCAEKEFKKNKDIYWKMKSYDCRLTAGMVALEFNKRLAAKHFRSAAKCSRQMLQLTKDQDERIAHTTNWMHDEHMATDILSEIDEVDASIALASEALAAFGLYRLTADKSKYTKAIEAHWDLRSVQNELHDRRVEGALSNLEKVLMDYHQKL